MSVCLHDLCISHDHPEATARDAKKVSQSQDEKRQYLSHDSLETFCTYFTFLVFSRAAQLYSTGSEFATIARQFGTTPSAPIVSLVY